MYNEIFIDPYSKDFLVKKIVSHPLNQVQYLENSRCDVTFHQFYS